MRTVTLGTDGLVDYVETPEGQRFTLGTVSVLKVVANFVRGRQRQRQALDEFNEYGAVTVALDLDSLLESLVPVRKRWAASPLIPGGDRTMDPAKHITEKLAATEQHLGLIARGMQAQQAPSAATLQTLTTLVASITLPTYPDQSKNDLFMGLGQPKVDTVPDGGYNAPKSVTHPTPGKQASTELLDRNVQVAQTALGQIESTLARVTEIEASRKASGKGGFNANKARAQLHGIAAKIAKIACEVDMAQPYVAAEIDTLATETAQIHDAFFPPGK